MLCCAEEPQIKEDIVVTVPDFSESTAATPTAETKEAPKIEPEPPKVEPEQVVKEEPATFRTMEVECLVDKNNFLGLEVSAATENHLVVKQVQPGVISKYNAQQASGSKVCQTDRILAINGEVSRAETLAAKLKDSSGRLTLKFEKPTILGVSVKRDKQTLGLSVQPKSDLGMCGLLITGIEAGCIADFNKAAPAARQVKVNDIIMGSFMKDAGGRPCIQKMQTPEAIVEYLAQDGALGLAVLSYS
eukprot:TRINITY_DN7634_c0_g2_i1.p1 TRINITY_DN7634_c0_g2~~TRINITY_DN7634_c0_g2_i1.p1  ORF type:complete len:246 (+),score=60.82 TRINITY_DN7634_c0_g2_i1:121-858(+)